MDLDAIWGGLNELGVIVPSRSGRGVMVGAGEEGCVGSSSVLDDVDLVDGLLLTLSVVVEGFVGCDGEGCVGAPDFGDVAIGEEDRGG